MHNRGTFVGKITCSRLMPALKQWSGTAWIAADLVPETVRPIRDPAKPRTIHKTTDFTSANSDGTTWDTVTDLSLTVAPSGTDMELEIRGVFSASGSAGFKYKFRAKQGSKLKGGPDVWPGGFPRWLSRRLCRDEDQWPG
jgi:hypothetical protein